MTLETKYYYGVPGTTWLADPTLIFVQVIRLTRQGLGYNMVEATPGNREFTHDQATGVLTFSDDEPFLDNYAPPSVGIVYGLERFMVVIKY